VTRATPALIVLAAAVCLARSVAGPAVAAQLVAPAPRVAFVVPLAKQPHDGAKETIWYDDFDAERTYTESQGGREGPGYGGSGQALLGLYEKDKQGLGNRKVFFGDNPNGVVARKGERFDDVFWRIYLKHQTGWTSGGDRGGPDKLSRATSIVSPRWNQAMFAHVWSSGDALTLDNASGVKDGAVVTTKYNDFEHMRWVGGNKPVSAMRLHSTEESGWWVCVEARAKLNTPGKTDAVSQLWIDGRLECERRDFDWRGTHDAFGINAVFLETWWNKGSPVEQRRWYDDFVISTRPIGPVVAPRRPEVMRTPYAGDGALEDWELEIAGDADGATVAWRSKRLGKAERVQVGALTGEFAGPATGRKDLPGGRTYWCRVRQKGAATEWSAWSGWHQAFTTQGE